MTSKKIAIVGEAWGEEEERQRLPFVGPSGHVLNRMLEQTGINRHECFVTNVFNLRPKPTNDITNLCGPQSDGIVGMESIAPGKYIRREFSGEVARLYDELRDLRPNLIIALGGTATWATLGQTGISKIRGTVSTGVGPLAGIKVLPTYHPTAIIRDWSLRVTTLFDLIKARRESEFPEIRRPLRSVWISPSLADLELFYDTYLRKARVIAFDIETSGDQITCIGFAPSPSLSLVIPFVDPRNSTGSYWPDEGSEYLAWQFVRRVLALPARKITQNGLYDVHFLWRRYGLTVTNWSDDTMLMHHAIQPESQKSLGFLGSIYTNETNWKEMRSDSETIKKDE